MRIKYQPTVPNFLDSSLSGLNITTKYDLQAVNESGVNLNVNCKAFYLSCSYAYKERFIGIAFRDSQTERRNYVGEVNGTTVTISFDWTSNVATISKSGGDYSNVYVFIRPLYSTK